MKKPKSEKMGSGTTLAAADADLGLLGALRGTMKRAIESLDRCVTRVDDMLQGGTTYDTKLGSHLVYLSEGGARVLGELRKLEAHDRNVVARMSPEERDELVRAYVAGLPRERRDAFRAFLDELDAKERGPL